MFQLEKSIEVLKEIRDFEQKMFERALKSCNDAEENEKLHVRQLVARAIQSKNNE